MKRRFISGGILVVVAVMVIQTVSVLTAHAVTPMERLSVSSAGIQGNQDSSSSSVSADGRYVVFTSQATNLTPSANTGAFHVYMRDRQTGETTLVSQSAAGVPGAAGASSGVISADGRYVAFYSFSSNLVPNTGGGGGIFVRDMQTGEVTIESVDYNGNQTGGSYNNPILSADGRYIAFASTGSSLVPGYSSITMDVFIRDRQTGVTTLASTDPSGLKGNGQSAYLSMSSDARYITFSSEASNILPGDTNGAMDVFVRDRQTGTTTRVTNGINGTQPNSDSVQPSISNDGQRVTYISYASNLVENDTNGYSDMFVSNVATGEITRVNVATDGSQANLYSEYPPVISGNGRYVAFQSMASNLVDNDTNGSWDTFVRDLQQGTTTRISVNADGVEGDGNTAYMPALTPDGGLVVFSSRATNMVAGDTNAKSDVFIVSNTAVAPPNEAPIANAGLDQTVSVGAVVTLDASASSDADNNNPLTYAWTLVSAPQGSSASISNPNTVDPSLAVDVKGEYTLSLIVTDSRGLASQPVQVKITAIDTLSLTPAKLWLGLQKNKDKGVKFDIRAEVYINGVLASEGQTICVTSLSWKENAAKQVDVAFQRSAGIPFNPGDTIAFKALARMGTNIDGSSCNKPKDDDAEGVRLFFDGQPAQSGLGIGINNLSVVNYYLDREDGDRVLTTTVPTGGARDKDSNELKYNNGNQWKQIGTWSTQL